MTASRFEDLPNELWLEVLVYFTWLEVSGTWMQWKLNHRIQELAERAQKSVALSLSSTSSRTSSEWLHYFEDEHPKLADRITSLLLNEYIVSNEILSRWLEDERSFLPRLRKCLVYIDLISGPARSNLLLLICRHALTLRQIVFYFHGINRYHVTMQRVIERGISLPAMQFILIKGKDCFSLQLAHCRRFAVKSS